MHMYPVIYLCYHRVFVVKSLLNHILAVLVSWFTLITILRDSWNDISELSDWEIILRLTEPVTISIYKVKDGRESPHPPLMMIKLCIGCLFYYDHIF